MIVVMINNEFHNKSQQHVALFAVGVSAVVALLLFVEQYAQHAAPYEAPFPVCLIAQTHY